MKESIRERSDNERVSAMGMMLRQQLGRVSVAFASKDLVGTSERRQHPSVSSSGGGRAASTTGAGSDGAESIAEWKRRSAEAGAHFFPLQRAEDAPSSLRDELRRRILASRVRREGAASRALLLDHS
ncbi:unnamed protein product [Closterium sp. NIES-64]|nr:unnamed protein product [Closterium sp. NIES-64]